MRHLSQRYSNTQKSGGFTLVEMAVVILIIGLITGSVFAIINPLNKNMREAETREKMEYIADTIANYAAKNNRIPCPAPADPSDNTGSVNQIQGIMYMNGSSGVPNCNGASERQGIVPFRTLGIHPDMAVDGWGNYFTYAVSPVFAMKTTGNAAHRNCRDRNWIDETNHNIAPDKAQFCCPDISPYDPDSDIVLKDENGDALFDKRQTGSGNYANVDTETTYNAAQNVTSVAFVLVSHGINHYGSYLINSANPSNRDTALSVTSADETENMDDDATYVTSPRILDEGSDYYDDIVLWRTQDQIRYEFGNDNCILP